MTTRRTNYDAIVVGVGGIGSATLYHLARRGLRVLGIEQFEIAHELGSSHGHTRVIRQAYFEHPDYVPLLLESYAQWRELELETGSSLLHQIGLLEVGHPEGDVIRGVLTAARQHGLSVQMMDAREAKHRFPAFSMPEEALAVYEPSAGYLRVEACVRAYVDAAICHQARVATREVVHSWSAGQHAIQVQTGHNRYETDHLVICAGAWSNQLLRLRGIPLEVRAKHLHWFPTDRPELAADRCPVFLYELGEGVFYGFPRIDALGVKLAEHSGGQSLDDASEVERTVDPFDLARVQSFARGQLPTLKPTPTHHSVCLYTMSPDGQFVVDLDRTEPNVSFVAGLSGHGFKFAPALGRALADLVLDKATDLPIGFLSLDRFGG